MTNPGFPKNHDDAPSFSSDDVITGAAQGQLRQFISRLERLAEDRAVIANDIREVMAEARGSGFDPKIIRKVLKIRATDKVKLAEEQALTEVYLDAMGAD